MEIEKSKVLIKFLLNFRQSGDVLFFLNIRRLRGYTATRPFFVKGHSHGQTGKLLTYSALEEYFRKFPSALSLDILRPITEVNLPKSSFWTLLITNCVRALDVCGES